MSRSRILPTLMAVAVGSTLVLRAVSVHSVGVQPLIYKVIANGNDLDVVEGIATPNRLIELWYKQRNFIEGDAFAPGGDEFTWCAWKNNNTPVHLADVAAGSNGIFRFQGLRTATTVELFPAAAGGGQCRGGLFTQLLVRACDAPGVNCSTWDVPTLHWLNVKKLNNVNAVAAGAVSDAERAAIAVADGPDDGPDPTDLVDVDQNFIDTTRPGFTVGQHVSWKCGQGGTAACPSITIHDGSTAISADPEFGYILGTIQAHRPGGSIFAASAIRRPEDSLGFQVNVNVKLRGGFDINLGCDRKLGFDFAKLPF